jgi:hypothetical protein
MSKEILVIALGVWVAVVPYLGVPGSWRTAILILSGIALMVLGFFLRSETLSRTGKRSAHHTFVENSDAVHLHEEDHDRKEKITSLN